MKLYNVVVRVVDLVWADSPEEAIQNMSDRIESKTRGQVMPDGNNAFVSEPVDSMGWAGE